MAEPSSDGGPGPTTPPPNLIALSNPRNPRSYSEPSQEQLIAEVRSLLSDLKQEAARLTAKVDRVELKSDNNEKTLVELKNLLAQLTPKLDDAAAFAKHRAPSLVDKADLTEATTKLRLEIDQRPTRDRKSVV